MRAGRKGKPRGEAARRSLEPVQILLMSLAGKWKEPRAYLAYQQGPFLTSPKLASIDFQDKKNFYEILSNFSRHAGLMRSLDSSPPIT